MIIFWLLALVLLIGATLLLLWPVLKVRKLQAEEDRTALNVALYQERLGELQGQLDQGTLSQDLFDQGRLEAERELLEDTAVGAPKQKASLGVALPLIATLLLPVAGIALYMVWGSSDQVVATLDRLPLIKEQQAVDALMARIPEIEDQRERDAAMNELVSRLENVVRLEPEAADVWFFLGRHYLNEQRPADAANAFSRAIEVAGRQPELLTQWLQAEFFANGNKWNDELQQAVDELLATNPLDAATLGLVGIAGFETGNFNVARDAWTRLLDSMDPREPSALAVLTGVERAEKAIAEIGENNPAATRGPILPPMLEVVDPALSGRLQVQVSLGDGVPGNLSPDTSVFVFARSPEAGSLPLAARRLTVGELPVTIVLSDADAVMSEFRLSTAGSIEVQASVAVDGNASMPDWLSTGMPAVVESGEVLELVIDQPAPER